MPSFAGSRRSDDVRAAAALVLVVLPAAIGCGEGARSTHESRSACGRAEPPADWTAPPGPYGANVGETLQSLTLDDCDGEAVELGAILASAELTLVSVGAGWCGPCIEESAALEPEFHRPFCGRGLAVVQILFQDDESFPATKLFCSQWRERFALELPVLVDPLFSTGRWFEAAQTPLNLLVDSSGVVRFRSSGTVPVDLADQIDALLPP